MLRHVESKATIPNLLAVYCSELDSLGHAEGPGGPDIAPALAALDRQLGRLVAAVRHVAIDRETAFPRPTSSSLAPSGWAVWCCAEAPPRTPTALE